MMQVLELGKHGDDTNAQVMIRRRWDEHNYGGGRGNLHDHLQGRHE